MSSRYAAWWSDESDQWLTVRGTAWPSEVTKLRDEVKGLYVETSSLRQQLDELKTEISGVNDNVSGFRTFGGFFIAVMILLLSIVFVMTVRR